MSRIIVRTGTLLTVGLVLVLGGCPSKAPDPDGFPAGTSGGTAGVGGAAGAAGTGVIAGQSGGTAGMIGGVGGVGGAGGTGGAGGVGGTGGAGGTAGLGGAGGSIDAGVDSGMMDAAVPEGDAGMSVSGIPADELAMLRQVCVDEINMYRATLSIAPIDRADPDQELCSDQGAKMDGDSMQAHGSAGANNPCNESHRWGQFPYFGAQNTCPGWPVGGGFGGFATIADALKNCLKGMWEEGEPDVGIDECIAQYRAGDQACFLAHGHYINMKGDGMGVSCGFYKMSSGKYWMNQDFY